MTVKKLISSHKLTRVGNRKRLSGDRNLESDGFKKGRKTQSFSTDPLFKEGCIITLLFLITIRAFI